MVTGAVYAVHAPASRAYSIEAIADSVSVAVTVTVALPT
jgi:hypothetical protein